MARPVDTTAGIGVVVRAIEALDRLDWHGFRSEVDSTDFTFSFLTIAAGRPLTQWRDVARAVQTYFDSVGTRHRRLGLAIGAIRASDSTYHMRNIYVRIDSGPVPGWWSFSVSGGGSRPWRIGLLYAIGEPEPLRHKSIPIQPPSSVE